MYFILKYSSSIRTICLYIKLSRGVARDHTIMLCLVLRNSSSVHDKKAERHHRAVLCENTVQTSEALKRKDHIREWIYEKGFFCGKAKSQNPGFVAIV